MVVGVVSVPLLHCPPSLDPHSLLPMSGFSVMTSMPNAAENLWAKSSSAYYRRTWREAALLAGKIGRETGFVGGHSILLGWI
jgi:hypothetical protein